MDTAKKILVVLVAVIAIVFAASTAGEANPTSSAVQVPEIINKAIEIAITALIAIGVNWLFLNLGLDLRQLAVPLSIMIATFIVAQLQGIINIIPGQFDFLVTVVLQIIATILGSIGLLLFRRPPATNSVL